MPATTFKLNPFIESKVRMWYRLHNKTRTGFIGRKDCSEMADVFTSQFDLDEKASNEIRSWLLDGWSSLVEFGRSVENGVSPISPETTPVTLLVAERMKNNDVITEDMYISAYSEIQSVSPELFSTCFSQMVGIFFDIFDSDKDGFITGDDMVKGLGCFGFRKSEAILAVFSDLDVEHCGKIDKETYVNAWLEFMTGHDEDAPMAKHFTPDIL